MPLNGSQWTLWLGVVIYVGSKSTFLFLLRCYCCFSIFEACVFFVFVYLLRFFSLWSVCDDGCGFCIHKWCHVVLECCGAPKCFHLSSSQTWYILSCIPKSSCLIDQIHCVAVNTDDFINTCGLIGDLPFGVLNMLLIFLSFLNIVCMLCLFRDLPFFVCSLLAVWENYFHYSFFFFFYF